MWYSQKHFPYLIGKPLVGPKSSLTGNCSGFDAEAWALHAGDPLYNMRNPCCVSGTFPPFLPRPQTRHLRACAGQLAWNKPGPWGSYLVLTDFAQAQIEQLVGSPEGRAAYANYVRLLTLAVADFPAAIGIELMNEPPTVDSAALYQLFHECHDAVRAISPDMAVGVMDFVGCHKNQHLCHLSCILLKMPAI